MALMYPPEMPPIDDKRNTAEPLLYALFRDELPDDFRVFHSVAWLKRDENKSHVEGEADFVIVHPRLGFVAIEAKSGGVYLKDGEWFYGSGRPMGKNPAKQASDFKYHLLNLLRNKQGWQKTRFHGTHAVAFPDVTITTEQLGTNLHNYMVLDQRARLDVLGWVEELFRQSRGEDNGDSLGNRDLDFLTNILAPTIRLRPLLSTEIRQHEQIYIELSQQQTAIIDIIYSQNRTAVAGCAGSGKTLIAAEISSRYAKNYPDKQVLLTCFNSNLANEIATAFLDDCPPNLTITNFHHLSKLLIEKAGMPFEPDKYDYSEFFAEMVPNFLMEAVDIIGRQYDAIIVDEGQDFLEDWWLPLQYLLHDEEEGRLHIFYDNNQNIYGGRRQIRNIVESPLPLTENWRNTQEINALVQELYVGNDDIRAKGPFGRAVEEHQYASDKQLEKLLSSILHRLIVDEQIAAEEIVILSPYRKKSWFIDQRIGNFQLTESLNPRANEVTCTTIYKFKGLESKVLILADIDQAVSQELLYIGYSRARSYLILLKNIGE